MSISVSKVTKFYGSQAALNDVSFEVDSGQIVGFLGPNGAGKSTMMKIITGFLSPSSGEVAVCGHKINEDPILYKSKIGYLPEHNPLFPEMYILEYLEFISNIYKIKNKRKKISEVVEMTGLTPEINKKIGELSKGYRQRVGLAQALIPDPEVLILDEPTTGLDPNQISDVRTLIKELGKSKTILLSTHIMQEVQAICERTIIINKGKLIADAHPNELEKLTTSNSNLIEVIFNKEIDRDKLLEIPGVIDATEKNGIWTFHTSLSEDVRPSIFNFAVKENIILLEMKQQKQSLENIFQDLTIS